MMKKVWLVLLAVVLVFGLVVSCGGSDDPAGGGVAVVAFKLSTILKELGESDSVVGEDLAGSPLVFAGLPTTKIVQEGEAFVIQMTTTANWGEGLDIKHGEGDDEFLFKDGDVLK